MSIELVGRSIFQDRESSTTVPSRPVPFRFVPAQMIPRKKSFQVFLVGGLKKVPLMSEKKTTLLFFISRFIFVFVFLRVCMFDSISLFFFFIITYVSSFFRCFLLYLNLLPLMGGQLSTEAAFTLQTQPTQA